MAKAVQVEREALELDYINSRRPLAVQMARPSSVGPSALSIVVLASAVLAAGCSDKPQEPEPTIEEELARFLSCPATIGSTSVDCASFLERQIISEAVPSGWTCANDSDAGISKRRYALWREGDTHVGVEYDWTLASRPPFHEALMVFTGEGRNTTIFATAPLHGFIDLGEWSGQTVGVLIYSYRVNWTQGESPIFDRIELKAQQAGASLWFTLEAQRGGETYYFHPMHELRDGRAGPVIGTVNWLIAGHRLSVQTSQLAGDGATMDIPEEPAITDPILAPCDD